MEYITLIEKINEYNIPPSWYSLNQGLKPNAYILVKNYDMWEYFYLDEKGDRLNERIFTDCKKAFDFFWQRLLFEYNHPPSIPPATVGI
jgi:hypothetical protein